MIAVTSRSTVLRRIMCALMSLVLIAGGVAAVVMAWLGFAVLESFCNPVAYCITDDHLDVVEKDGNRMLELEYGVPGEPLRLLRSYPVERDDPWHYYMVRHMFDGPNGIVIESHVYSQKAQVFKGYRFREYRGRDVPPRSILTIFLKDPSEFPEIYYSHDAQGNNYFVNNIRGRKNIWKVPPHGEVLIRDGEIPEDVEELGEENDELAAWADICVGPDGRIYVTSRSSGQVVEYSPEGRRLRKIGKVGFDEGELLAPEEVFFVAMGGEEKQELTVASSGNRTWVQFDTRGHPIRSISPFEMGYPFRDILVGRIRRDKATGRLYSFDLANKALVEVGDRLRAVTSYLAHRRGWSGGMAVVGVVLILLGVFRRRWTIFFARLRYPSFVKMLLLFLPVLALSTWYVGEEVRRSMTEDLRTETVRRLANLAHAICDSVSVADLEAIHAPEDRDSAAYERVFKTASQIVDIEHVKSTPKWIIHKIRNGRYYFGINIWRGAIYEPFFVPPDREMFFDVLRDKVCRWGSFTDDQGEWFSYLCPILDENGEVINVVEVYKPTEELKRAGRKAAGRVNLIIAVTIVLTAILVFVFAFVFTRPLRELSAGAEVVSKGDFDHRIDIHSRDELGRLAVAFNKMVVDLKQYTRDLARTTAEKERIESELQFAREVQQGALPREFPPFEGAENIDISAKIQPARMIGGDYFDFFFVDEHHLGVVVADVSGKGMPAGLFLMMLRTELREAAARDVSVRRVMNRVNGTIADDNPSNMFASVFYFICDMRTGQVTYANGGHPPPIIVRPGEIATFGAEAGKGLGPVVGVMEEADYTEASIRLEDGDRIFLYTDGVTEAMNVDGEMYGDERLLDTVKAGAREDACLCDRVFEDVLRYQEGLEQYDDVTVLCFRYRARA